MEKFDVIIAGEKVEGIVPLEYDDQKNLIEMLMRDNNELLYGIGDLPVAVLGNFRAYKQIGIYDRIMKIPKDKYFEHFVK